MVVLSVPRSNNNPPQTKKENQEFKPTKQKKRVPSRTDASTCWASILSVAGPLCSAHLEPCPSRLPGDLRENCSPGILGKAGSMSGQHLQMGVHVFEATLVGVISKGTTGKTSLFFLGGGPGKPEWSTAGRIWMATIVFHLFEFPQDTLRSPSSALSHFFFGWEGSPTKIDYRNKIGYPYSNLSTGGPRHRYQVSLKSPGLKSSHTKACQLAGVHGDEPPVTLETFHLLTCDMCLCFP